MLAIADRDRTLTGGEQGGYHDHLAGCESCRTLAGEHDDDFRWVARLPDDAFDDPDALVLPTIDPAVYAVDSQIASGGMGRITRASDRRLGREVAIKEVLEPALRARFEREAMITARLQHPAIVPIYEAGMWPNGSPFYAMRLVRGTTLAECIDATTTIAERLALLSNVIAVTDALAYAHGKRVIHRDLKPGNVLVGEFGETVVIDWGLAKELDRAVEIETDGVAPTASGAGLTRVGAVMGTPSFMAPEQATGRAIDERGDVYALGALLYNVLTGMPPYWDTHAGTGFEALLEIGVLRAPTPIATLAPDAPADLCAIAEHAMARRPADRYPTAKPMAEELRRFQAGKLVAAHDYTLRELVGRWVRRHRAAVAIGAIGLVAVAVIGVLAVVNVTGARDDATSALASEQVSASALLEEQGRAELLDGDPQRALVYLNEALQRGRDNPALRHLLAAAMRTIDTPELDVPADVQTLGAQASGAVVAVEQRAIVVWRDGLEVRRIVLPHKAGTAYLDPGATQAAILRGKRTLELWDIAEGTMRWRADEPVADDPAMRIVWDRTGARLAVIAGDDERQLLHVRDAATGTVVANPEMPGDIDDAAWGGDLIAMCVRDGDVRVWNVATAKLVAELKSTIKPQVIAFAGRDHVVLGGDRAGELWTIGESPPKRIATLANHRWQITHIAVSDDGLIATGDLAGEVRLWAKDGAPRGESRALDGATTGLVFGPGHVLIGNSLQMDEIVVWNVAVGLEPLRLINAHRNATDDIALVAGGRIASAGGDNRVRLWKLPPTGRVAWIYGHHPSGGDAVWLNAGTKTTTIRRMDTGAVERTIGPLGLKPEVIVHHELSRDGTRFVYEREDQAVVVDTTTDKRIELAGATGTQMRLSADGRFVVDTELDHGAVRVYDTATGKLVLDAAQPGVAESVAIAPDGARVALLFDGHVDVVEVASNTSTRYPVAGSLQAFGGVEFDSSGRVVVAYTGPIVTVIDTVTSMRTLLLNPYSVDRIAVSRDGTRVLARAERKLLLWDARTGAQLALVDHESAGAFAFARDGERFATGSSDGWVRIWSANGRLLARTHAHRSNIDDLAFSADGARLVAGGRGRSVVLLDVDLDRSTPAAIAAVAARAPWKLLNGQLFPR